jgi:hypothetical protein
VQQKYKSRVQVLLVSIEEEEKLKKFIANRANFLFPLAVDNDNAVTSLFQPPSYPYTVVLGKSGKVLAQLTDAAQLTNAAIETWLADTAVAMKAGPITETTKTANSMNSKTQLSGSTVLQLSQSFLYAAKTGESTEPFKKALKELDYEVLKKALQTDTEKKAFWINLYNAFTNDILKANPEKYSNRGRFFGAKQIEVAGKRLSLDQIEHDFLRRTKIKWGLGHLNQAFPSPIAKELRVEALDYRIHFALNCGAKSCPPIAYYTPVNLDQQLELATKNYLTGEVDYKKETTTVYLPAIASWFRADFGGKKGMLGILKKHGIIPQQVAPKIKFKKYDWTLELNNYKI